MLQLENELYKATVSYGYGLEVNLMQLLRAYSAFNNDGKIVTPYLVERLIDERDESIEFEHAKAKQILKSSVAQRMKNILIKTVLKGTGTNAITEGLTIGGKTGTAHIVEKGRYVKKYNTSFLGFANDQHNFYSIGAVVRQPTKSHFASQTAVVAFKNAVDIMVEEGFLKPTPKAGISP